MTASGRRGWTALAFAAAALLTCWSPLAAPFALITGLGAAVLAIRARRDGGRAAWIALAAAGLAVVVSGRLLALAAGAGRAGLEAPPPPSRGERETSRRLDAAAEQTRAERERAERQLAPAPAPRQRN